MSELRFCVTHWQRTHPSDDRCNDVEPCAEFVSLVESRESDGRLLALLVVDDCGECDGDGEEVDTAFGDPTFNDADRVPVRYSLLQVCSSCAGRGWQPRAEETELSEIGVAEFAVVVPVCEVSDDE